METTVINLGGAGWAVTGEGFFLSAFGPRGSWTSVEENAAVYDSVEQAEKASAHYGPSLKDYLYSL